VPVITIVLSLVLLGEVPAPLAYLGGALALVGVAVSRSRRRTRPESDDVVTAPPSAATAGSSSPGSAAD